MPRFRVFFRWLSLSLLLLASLYSLSRPAQRAPVCPAAAASLTLLSFPNNDQYLNASVTDRRGTIVPADSYKMTASKKGRRRK